MSANYLRSKYNRRFTGLSRLSDRTSWGIVAGYLGQVALAIGAGAYLLSQPAEDWTVLALVGLVLFIGTRLRGLNNIIHECSHATFAVTRSVNYRIGRFCAAMIFGCFKNYRDEHLSHHAHLGDPEQDLDLKRIAALRLDEPLSTRTILRHALTPFTLLHLRYYLSPNMGAVDGRVYQLIKFGLVAAIAAVTLMFPLTGLVMVLVPLFLVFPTLNYWADCIDHAGLIGKEDDLDASRNVAAPSMLRVIFFPRNDCYHLVHHLFPQIPARHLEAGHQLLVWDDVYRSRSNAVPAARSPIVGTTEGVSTAS